MLCCRYETWTKVARPSNVLEQRTISTAKQYEILAILSDFIAETLPIHQCVLAKTVVTALVKSHLKACNYQ